MGYLIFRGINTQSLDGVYVSKMPSHKKASQRFTEYYVKGRDGALHVNEGYANFTLTTVLVLINADVSARQIVNAWADGSGKLITSDDLTHAYNAIVEEEVEWLRVKANSGFYDTATIKFNCQPFMVEAVDSQIELLQTGSVLNYGSAESFPLIQVEGSGNVSFEFAGYPIEIDGMTQGTPVYIDCATGYVYTLSGAATMRGEIPKFEMGTNNIVFGEGLTRLLITPHWRWV